MAQEEQRGARVIPNELPKPLAEMTAEEQAEESLKRFGHCDARPGKAHCLHQPWPDHHIPADRGRVSTIRVGLCCFCAPAGVEMQVHLPEDDGSIPILQREHGPRLTIFTHVPKPLQPPNGGLILPGNLPPGLPFPPLPQDGVPS